ncbi:carbohydrate ABC transporter permease [Pumilibacter muris]|uniref:carbohydrate ABC transporter permease n=1 Tax=Pumilibacter muris TaxID=2941510 RepID=UPI00203BD77F|nr:carbohydrate ABC transporter permease [Pumilibacter muris]
MAKTGTKIAQGVFKALLLALMLAYCLSLIFTLVWMLYTSFKTEFEYIVDAFAFPKQIGKIGFSNYSEMFKIFEMKTLKNGAEVVYRFPHMFGYSLIWALLTSLVNVFFTTLVAYVVAKYKFFGRNFLYALGIFVMITPIVGNLPSAMQVKQALGIYNNIWLTILTSPQTVFSGVHFMLMHAAFKHISWNYAEAAFIDGASHYRVMFQIMFPLVLPTCVVLYVLNFLGAWNDYSTFIIWLPSYPTLAYGMLYFQSQSSKYGATMPVIMAGFTIVAIPNIVLYLLSQNLIMSKFSVGGLKE